MSGMIGKAMRFARSSQGKKALAKARSYASSPEGRERIGGVKERMQDLRGGKANRKPEATTVTPSAPSGDQQAPQPDPGAPTTSTTHNTPPPPPAP